MSNPGSPPKYEDHLKDKSISQIIEVDDDDEMKYNKKNKKPGFCWSHFQDFSSSTSLHGIQYLGESKRSVIERTWWLIMIVLSITGCSYMIYKIWKKWDQSPVIVSFAETSMPVWQIPFPAITICSEMKIRRSVFNFTENYHDRWSNYTEEQIFEREAASLLCDYNLEKGGNMYGNKSTLEFMKNAAHEHKKFFSFCEWKSEEISCKNLFKPILTEEGQCYTYNILTAEELFRKKMIYNGLNTFEHGKKSSGWNIDIGYPKNVSVKAYPERGIISGVEGGLSITLTMEMTDMDYLCTSNPPGFKISLHSPADFPRVSRKHFVLPVNNEMIVAIKPDMLTTSSGLAIYEPQRRKCYRNSERKLKFFRVYTQQNCQLECLANYTKNLCDCVAFWMPRDKNISICSSGKKECMNEAQADLESYEIRYAVAVQNDDQRRIKHMKKMSCDCLPGCTSINYDVETSQADFKITELIKAWKMEGIINSTLQYSRIKLFFKGSDFITSRRSELYGVTDFLANCGGILGLFLGFSFLSLVEILYFLTIGPVCNLHRRISVARNKFQKSWKERRN